MMICTSGHVDHGKTSLVKMLTGCSTDRLKEEIERGLTIELGFAPCFIGGDLCVGVVDVPGHEKFIKNMVAGVSGIDLAILVIAADDGIMPQTIEHVQIMELLGVRHGLVALTKIDLVDAAQLATRRAEIAGFLHGTFLDGAPICPVSSQTFAGYPEFYDTLVERIGGLRRQRAPGVFRMPVERAFARHGFGAVVSGIPVDGRIRTGDLIERVPGHETGHVRGLQCFLRQAAEGGTGQCLALNVPEFGKTPPERGDVLALPGYLREASIFHVRLRTVPGLSEPLENAEEIKFHTGTAEQPGRLYLLEAKTLGAADSALATIVTAAPVVAAPGDRFIVRRPSPAATVSGGEILLVSGEAARPRRQEILERLRAQEAFFAGFDPNTPGGRARRVEYALLQSRRRALAADEIARAAMLRSAAAAARLAELAAAGRVRTLDGGHFVHADTWAACLAEVDARLRKAGTDQQLLSMSVNDLRAGIDWPAPLWNRVLREIEQTGRIGLAGERVLLQTSTDALPPSDRDLARRLLGLYDDTGFHSPHPDEIAAQIGEVPAAVKRMMEYLLNRKDLFKIADNVVLSRRHLKAAQDLVAETIRRDGVLRSPEFKDQIASTRKYAIAILDFLDLRRVTLRVGNDRKLLPGYEKHLI